MSGPNATGYVLIVGGVETEYFNLTFTPAEFGAVLVECTFMSTDGEFGDNGDVYECKVAHESSKTGITFDGVLGLSRTPYMYTLKATGAVVAGAV
jgi:hypothetical protein